MASTRKRGNSWEYRVSYKNDKGQYRELTKSGFKTKREAQLAGNDLEIELNRNRNVLKGSMPVGDFFEWYYYTKKENNVGAQTQRVYLASIQYVKDYFKQKALRDITNSDYQNLINSFGVGHAKSTVEKFHYQLRSSFKYAHANGYINIDPSFDINIAYDTNTKKQKIKYISEGELKKLLETIRDDLQPDDVVRHLLIMAIASGARFSEIIALRYDDYDEINATITINKSHDHVITHKDKTTKTGYSDRVVKLDYKANLELKRYKEHIMPTSQNNPENYLFWGKYNRPVGNNMANHVLKQLCKISGIQTITCHALRHTHASVLLKNGVAIEYISKRLGHSSVAITQKHYIHIIEELMTISDGLVNDIYSKF